jgi:hypothetical protein
VGVVIWAGLWNVTWKQCKHPRVWSVVGLMKYSVIPYRNVALIWHASCTLLQLIMFCYFIRTLRVSLLSIRIVFWLNASVLSPEGGRLCYSQLCWCLVLPLEYSLQGGCLSVRLSVSDRRLFRSVTSPERRRQTRKEYHWEISGNAFL